MSVNDLIKSKENMIVFLCDFVVYNSFVGDNNDYVKLKKNAKEFLKEVGFKEGSLK